MVSTPQSSLSGRVRCLFHYSCSLIAIVLMTRSGSGLAGSVGSSPFFRSAPSTCIPSASTKVRWKWRAAVPRWMYCRALSSCWRPRMTSWFSSIVTSSWSRVKPATAGVMRKPFGLAVGPVAPLDAVAEDNRRALYDAVERTLDFVESQEGTDWTTMEHETLQSPLEATLRGPAAPHATGGPSGLRSVRL